MPGFVIGGSAEAYAIALTRVKTLACPRHDDKLAAPVKR